MNENVHVVYLNKVLYDNTHWVVIAAGIMLAYYLITLLIGIKWKKDIIIPTFSVPRNLSPVEVGYLINGDFRVGTVSALIVGLSLKKYIVIDDVKASRYYQIEMIRRPDEGLTEDERNFMETVFEHRYKVVLQGDTDSAFVSACEQLEHRIRNRFRKLMYRGFRARFYLIFTAGLVSTLYFALGIYSYIKGNFVEVFELLYLIGYYIFLAVAFLLMRPERRTKRRLKKILLIISGLLIAWQIYRLVGANPQTTNYLRIRCFLLCNFTILFFIQDLFNKVSKEYRQLLLELAGFRMYLGTAEEKQIQFFNPPKKTPELFEKYLPYAMIFGVQKIWGKGFERLAEDSTYSFSDDSDLSIIMDATFDTDNNLLESAIKYALLKNVVDIFK